LREFLVRPSALPDQEKEEFRGVQTPQTVLRDTWWRWHIVRLTCGIGGLLLLIVVNVAGASSKK
jgi:hypothetical protein